MDGFEIVAPAASGEAVFSGFTLKWLMAFKIDKMVTRGRLSIHLQEAPKLSKERGEGHFHWFSKLKNAAQKAFLSKSAKSSCRESNRHTISED